MHQVQGRAPVWAWAKPVETEEKFVTMWFNLHADMHITVLSVDFYDFTMTELHELSV